MKFYLENLILLKVLVFKFVRSYQMIYQEKSIIIIIMSTAYAIFFIVFVRNISIIFNKLIRKTI